MRVRPKVLELVQQCCGHLHRSRLTLLIPISATVSVVRSPGGREVTQATRAAREPPNEDLADQDYA
jgi:hypothetical protein